MCLHTSCEHTRERTGDDANALAETYLERARAHLNMQMDTLRAQTTARQLEVDGDPTATMPLACDVLEFVDVHVSALLGDLSLLVTAYVQMFGDNVISTTASEADTGNRMRAAVGQRLGARRPGRFTSRASCAALCQRHSGRRIHSVREAFCVRLGRSRGGVACACHRSVLPSTGGYVTADARRCCLPDIFDIGVAARGRATH